MTAARTKRSGMDTGLPVAEMNRRIKALVARERTGAAAGMTVRHVTPAREIDRGDVRERVLAALGELSFASNARNLARLTGLSQGLVSAALRELSEDGRVVRAGERQRAMGQGFETTWTVPREEAS